MNNYDDYVEQALSALPEQLRNQLTNLAFVVDDGRGPISDCGQNCREEVLGLYEGYPLTEREGDPSGLLPDKITLFRRTIEDVAKESGVPVAQVVRETVWHEVSHYFGFDEDKAEEMERKWEGRIK